MKKTVWLVLVGLSWATVGFGLDSSEIRNPGDGVASHQLQDPKEAIARVPAFVTDTRTDKMMFYPCTNCHVKGMVEPNPKVRTLEEMHFEVQLQHGGGRFWCLTCHSKDDRNHLVSLKKQPISFDQPHLLCGQCHFARQRDFFRGAHGKRKGNWKGEKRLTNCTECHNPHAPSIPARLPRAKPADRIGHTIVPSTEHGFDELWEIKEDEHHSKPKQKGH